MAITFTCPRCGEHNQAIDEMAGEEVTCHACGAAVSLPVEALTTRPVPMLYPDERGAGAPTISSSGGKPKPLPARRKSRTGDVLLAVGVAAKVCLIGAIVVMAPMWFTDGPTDTAWNKVELNHLDTALAAFKTAYPNVPHYPPSQLKLCRLMKDYDVTSQLDRDSMNYLIAMFPGIDIPNGHWSTTGINWSGTNDEGPVILEGDQCLVFFLGGISVNSGSGLVSMGFSTDNTDPARLTGPRRPVFPFRPERLALIHGNAFPSYQDHYGKNCFAYFSSYGNNRYDRYGNTDCPTLGVWPYIALNSSGSRPAQYYNPTTCQIISAGKDGVFGPGSKDPTSSSFWTPQNVDVLTLGGRDDQTNFYGKQLGFPTR